MLWRTLTPLTYKNTTFPVGRIALTLRLSESQATKLQQAGAIAPVYAPPLSILPGWKERAVKLSEIEINLADEFIEAEDTRLVDVLGVSHDTIETLKQELVQWLS